MTYATENHAVGAIHESPAVGTIDKHRTKGSLVQREVPRRGGGIESGS